MAGLRDGVEPNATVNQFVWACVAGPKVTAPACEQTIDGPKFTVLIRTQGRRVHELQEVFTCLAAQSDQDFEVVLVAHRVEDRSVVDRLVDDTTTGLKAKTRVVHADRGNRATLLNIGFAEARGRYVTVLDDDDLVLGHWIETFSALDRKHRGQVLRSLAVVQGAARVEVLGQHGIRATTSPEMVYEPEFSYVNHLLHNQSPFMTLAFPRSLFRDLGVRFDESLTTTEDWDYLLRAGSIVGVADSREIVAIYHRWVEQESSATEHDAEVWRLNELFIRRNIDARPLLLQPGESRRIRELVESEHLHRALVSQESIDPRDPDRAEALHRLASLLDSTSWKVTSPLRWAGWFMGRGHGAQSSHFTGARAADIQHAIAEVERSRSWRLSRWLLRK
nr:glycosyltransferase family 2 protein [Plantibacter sp. VKM Ac-2885]